MKAVLVGIGSFGYGWYQTLKQYQPKIDFVVVDRNARAAARLLDPVEPFYTDFVEALEKEKPDFVVNVTPPAVHTSINHLAFDHGLPVLCEKPIAEDYAQAVEIVARARQEHIPFMIAENYRRTPAFRKARQWIEAGRVGEVSAIYVCFYKERYFEKEYLLNMPDPLLMDVTVHHFDLMRYLTGSEGRQIFAYSFNPAGSRYPGRAALNCILEMENNTRITYAGSLASKDLETTWNGEWRVEGTRAVLRIGDDRLELAQSGSVSYETDFSDVDSSTCLDAFLRALSENSEPETSAVDYLNTQKLVHYARLSAQQKCWVAVEK